MANNAWLAEQLRGLREEVAELSSQVAGGGGGNTPGSALKFGTDITLLHGWTTVSEPGDQDFTLRLYEQGGRGWLTGILGMPSGGPGQDIAVLPEAFKPARFGIAEADYWLQPSVRSGNETGFFDLKFDSGNWVLGSVYGLTPGTGHYVEWENISWPLASA